MRAPHGAVPSGLSLLLAIPLLPLLCAASCWEITPPPPGDGKDKALLAPTRDELLAILQHHRSLVLPRVSAAVRADVEAFAAQFPLESPAGLLPIEPTGGFDESGTMGFEIRRRDWAYALHGGVFTLAAAGGGQGWLDAGFWCYLEATLLNPDEPDHLANVGFHLNARHECRDAARVLAYARAIDASHQAVLNNLGYAHAACAEFARAIEATIAANGAGAVEDGRLERLAEYYEAIGDSELAQAVRSRADRELIPPNQWSLAQLSAWQAMYDQFIRELMDRDLAALEAANPERGRLADQYAEDGRRFDEAMEACRKVPVPVLCEPALIVLREMHCGCIPSAHLAFLAGRANHHARIIALEMATETHLWAIAAEFRSRGVAFLERIATLSDAERAAVARRWEELVLVGPLTHRKVAIPEALDFARRDLAERHQALRDQMAFGCEPVSTQTCPQGLPTAFTINLGIASAVINTNGTVSVSIGGGTRVEVQYDVHTGLSGVGVAVGINLGPLLEGGVYVTLRDGEAEIGATLGARVDSPVAPGSTTLANPKLMLWQNQRVEQAGRWSGSAITNVQGAN